MNIKELVIATNNRHKIKEISDLANGKIVFRSLQDIGCNETLPEEYFTLRENAQQKARYVFDKYGVNCFADDTGLEVEALKGEPGVFSARYAGKNATFEDNVCKLLKNMEGIDNRKALFRTVICLIENGEELFFEGVCKGTIIRENKGSDGFGYDPVFLPECFEQTFAQMTLEQKNSISHRSIATTKLLNYLLK
ncbi:MAG: RdgB/HAM1 family non-canonical purine NTP pyrophosphatase [Bacteroidales bacterium]|jgi:XTP/dITP diphosphohydrolase|nr:RdgB/HAM1 family non-canonical purine NTP pyrophosphatase [Bacteroidales bacterium]